MSRSRELAYEAAKNTTMTVVDNRTIEFMNASLLWPDFEGRVTKYHVKEGAQRSFNIVLNDDILAALKEMEERTGSKFYIRSVSVSTEEGAPLMYYINVKVSYRRSTGEPVSNPPRVVLLTNYNGKKSRTTLDEETVKMLDRIDIKNVDFRVNCYSRAVDPTKCTMYLRNAFVEQDPDIEFGGKYDDWDDSEQAAAQPSAPFNSEEEIF